MRNNQAGQHHHEPPGGPREVRRRAPSLRRSTPDPLRPARPPRSSAARCASAAKAAPMRSPRVQSQRRYRHHHHLQRRRALAQAKRDQGRLHRGPSPEQIASRWSARGAARLGSPGSNVVPIQIAPCRDGPRHADFLARSPPFFRKSISTSSLGAMFSRLG